jgi:hypothetical protein
VGKKGRLVDGRTPTSRTSVFRYSGPLCPVGHLMPCHCNGGNCMSVGWPHGRCRAGGSVWYSWKVTYDFLFASPTHWIGSSSYENVTSQLIHGSSLTVETVHQVWKSAAICHVSNETATFFNVYNSRRNKKRVLLFSTWCIRCTSAHSAVSSIIRGLLLDTSSTLSSQSVNT